MAKVLPDGVTIINTMADGSECDDLSTYIKSVDQLSDLTKRMVVYFCELGARERAKQKETVGG